jgi:hypothetical protein
LVCCLYPATCIGWLQAKAANLSISSTA